VCVCVYVRVCVCVCVRARGSARVLTCICVGARASACAHVALLIQHATCSHIAICSVSGSTTFSDIISHTARFFGKMLLNIKCVFWFSLQLFSRTFLILKIIQLDIVINVKRSSSKVPVILVRFYWNLNFLDRFSDEAQRPHFIKIHSVGPRCSMRTDGYDEVNSCFSKFCLKSIKTTLNIP
jgi:hypothetical protein